MLKCVTGSAVTIAPRTPTIENLYLVIDAGEFNFPKSHIRCLSNTNINSSQRESLDRDSDGKMWLSAGIRSDDPP